MLEIALIVIGLTLFLAAIYYPSVVRNRAKKLSFISSSTGYSSDGFVCLKLRNER